MPRGKNAHNKKSYYSSTSYPPSPPPQLPTPLPDEPVLSHSVSRMEGPEVLSPLIDFDTPTPPQAMIPLPADTGLMLGSDIDDDIDPGRSPPFREAPLPQDSPPPLPIRPRVAHWTLRADQEYQRSMEDTMVVDERSFIGHSRTPNFSRPGTRTSSTSVSPIYAPSSASASTLENLSRTIRGYVHSSVPIPTSPASNSRAVAIGTASGSPSRQDRASQQEFERDYELDNEEDNDNDYYDDSSKRHHHTTLHHETNSGNVEGTSGRQPTRTMGSSGLAQAMRRNVDADSRFRSDQVEAIAWARWDALHDRRLLIVGHVCGLQVWDCTNLSSVDEILNVNLDSDEWRMLLETEGSGTTVRVVHAAVLPSPSHQSVHYGDIDPYRAKRPLLGILLESATEGTPEQAIFFIYSVQHKHQVVKRLSLPGAPSTFVSNEHFTVISTSKPPILHILSSSTFQTLHEISSSSLELFIPQVSFISHAIANVHSSSTSVQIHSSTPQDVDPATRSSPTSPVPVFALSHRLLAYTSSSPSAIPSASQEPLNVKDTRRFSSSSNASTIPYPESSVSSSPFGFGPPGLEQITAITRADVGHAALKVGETVFNGMKYFGGIALEAAKNRVASGQPFGVGIRNQHTRSGSGRESSSSSSGGRFVSRSAPESLSVHDETEPKLRRSSSTLIGDPHGYPTKVAPSTKPSRERGHHVTVVDLAPLYNRRKVSKVDEIRVSTSQPAVKIEFSADGTSIGVALKDGHSTKVFKLKPSPHIVAPSFKEKASEGSEIEYQRSTAAQVYNLRRGRTSAVVESIVWAKDGRYLGVGTMNRTVHIYAVNPYGGKSDLRSHLEGRIRNVEAVDHSMTILSPIARLRATKSQVPLALTFISDAELAVAPHLLPPTRSTRSPTFSPPDGKLGTNYQHILLFDPEDGVLSLHRLTLEKSPPGAPIISGVAASIQALGVTSMSFPGSSNLGRLSTSPSAKPVAIPKPPESSMELAAKDNQVATYNLRRGRDWEEVTKPFETAGPKKQRTPGGDWLAEAELSTCSSSQQVVPRSIYLSHQFSFHTLGEDYHALIRGYQLHVSGNKIDVRKEVEIRTSAWNIATFAEGFPSALDTQRDPSSSFDEPISSAISGSFDNSKIPRILPMYPNGLPGANVKSLRNSIPIRAISGLGDGVSEGFGRIRKEMHRVRAPTVATHRSDISSVPLEFDEDEEFLEQHGEILWDTSGGGVQPTSSSHILSCNISTQKLLDADVVGTVDEELFDGWDVDDKQAIDEVEQFQDIVAVVEEEDHRQQDKRKRQPKR